jgi:hypothetical protein
MKLSLARFACASSLVGLAAIGGASATVEAPAVANPAAADEPVVQVWGARTRGAKGIFGVHTWVAVKPGGASEFTVYEVIGWRLRWAESVVVARHRPHDNWWGAPGELYAEKRGAGVEELIRRIDQAAHAYPFADQYTLWPGPNSNTFTAWIARSVPELEVDLPATAIGKDYIGGNMISTAPSGSGFQFTLRGLLGLSASGVEGLEINVLGLNFGVGPSGIKLPMIGLIGSPRIDPVLAIEAAVTP